MEVSSLCCSSAAQRCCLCSHGAQPALRGAALCARSYWGKVGGKGGKSFKTVQFGCAEELCMCALCAYRGRLWSRSIVHVSMIYMVSKSLASTSAVEM